MLLSKEDHPKYPPSTWTVRKCGRKWALCINGHPTSYFTTKREAEQAKIDGFEARLYEQEGRWFAGEKIPGWKLYAQAAG